MKDLVTTLVSLAGIVLAMYAFAYVLSALPRMFSMLP